MSWLLGMQEALLLISNPLWCWFNSGFIFPKENLVYAMTGHQKIWIIRPFVLYLCHASQQIKALSQRLLY